MKCCLSIGGSEDEAARIECDELRDKNAVGDGVDDAEAEVERESKIGVGTMGADGDAVEINPDFDVVDVDGEMTVGETTGAEEEKGGRADSNCEALFLIMCTLYLPTNNVTR